MWFCCLDWSETPLETLLQQSSLFLNIVWARKLLSAAAEAKYLGHNNDELSKTVFITLSSCVHLNNVLGCGHKPWQSWPLCGRHQHTERTSVAQGEQSEWGSASPYPCPGQTSPLLSLAYCTHTHGPKKEGMPKIALAAWLPGPQWWWCPGLGPVLYLVPAWPMSHICGEHNHKISQVFLTLFTVKWKWRESENKVELQQFQCSRCKVTKWPVGSSHVRKNLTF